MTSPSNHGVDEDAKAWWRAAANADVIADYDSIRLETEEQMRPLRPVCLASGRCCRFDQFGHRLYVTGLEAAIVVSRLSKIVTHAAVLESRRQGTCPFLLNGNCSIHPIRPIPCRAFFCDLTVKNEVFVLHERAHEAVRFLHDKRAIPYGYGEWRDLLDRVLSSLP
ncbi:MAG: hypothetical protein O2800_01730 [Planctomycetota bacterium]|nr:hypothetical protein [Planctomycetota bacterium]